MSNTYHQVHKQMCSAKSTEAVIRATQKARGASRGGPRELQAWVEVRETTVSPGYGGKGTFVVTYFLKCLRLVTQVLSHLPRAAMTGLLRGLPAPTCSKGSNEAGWQGGGCSLAGCSRPLGAPLKTLADKTIPQLWSMPLVRQRP